MMRAWKQKSHPCPASLGPHRITLPRLPAAPFLRVVECQVGGSRGLPLQKARHTASYKLHTGSVQVCTGEKGPDTGKYRQIQDKTKNNLCLRKIRVDSCPFVAKPAPQSQKPAEIQSVSKGNQR
jgi:hypothetical protein